jgi:hypothetical protein
MMGKAHLRRDLGVGLILFAVPVNGRPRQVCVIWQNKRCSILFHFEAPGG